MKNKREVTEDSIRHKNLNFLCSLSLTVSGHQILKYVVPKSKAFTSLSYVSLGYKLQDTLYITFEYETNSGEIF